MCYTGGVMIISNLGVKFIQSWESFKSKAYLDQAGIWTIGFGTIKYFNGKLVQPGDTITLADATLQMLSELDGICSKVNSFLKVTTTQNQYDALISLAYNIGTQGFKSSTLLRKLNSSNSIQEDYFTRWNKVHIDGKLVMSAGLLRRRKSEWKLFRVADYTGNSAGEK